MAEVEVDEVSGLVSDVRPKIPAHNAMPSGVVFLVKLLEPGKSLVLPLSSKKFRNYQKKGKLSV